MNPELLIFTAIGAAAALILGVWATWQAVSLRKLRQSFFSGKTGQDLEAVIVQLAQNQEQILGRQMTLDRELSRLEHNLSLGVQKIGLVRFNPFADGGGNFSFCLALLDGQENGLVLTSMHGREQNRIYTKRIKLGASDSQLTEEEQQAINLAQSQHKSQVKRPEKY